MTTSRRDAEFPAPVDCNRLCLSEVVGDRARDIAQNLGTGLALKLKAYTSPTQRDDPGMADDGYGLEETYSITLRNFDDDDARYIVGNMTAEFTGYRSLSVIEKSLRVQRYRYVTTAKSFKLEEWFAQLVRELGFEPQREVLIAVRGTTIGLERIRPPSRPRESLSNRKRFE